MEITESDRSRLVAYGLTVLTIATPELADDMVQSAIAKAWKSRDNYTEQGQLTAFLRLILRREFIRYLDRLKLEKSYREKVLKHENKITHQVHFDARYEDLIQAGLDGLNPGDLEALLLRAKGMTTPEIAEALGIMPRAATARLYRARQGFIKSTGLTCMQDYFNNEERV